MIKIDNKLTEKQQKMVADNHNLIYAYLSRHRLNYEEYYDLLAIALCKAVLKFDENKGCSFSTYAWSSFRNAIITEYKKQKDYEPIHITEVNENRISYDVSKYKQNEDRSYAEMLLDEERLLEILTPRETEVYNYYKKGYTLRRIAKIFGVSNQAVSQKFCSIKEKIRRLYSTTDDEEHRQKMCELFRGTKLEVVA